MKKTIYFILFLLTCNSCDDGDILMTGFDFDKAKLELCTNMKNKEFIFFKINETILETVSLKFTSDLYSDTKVTNTPILIDISKEENSFIYRRVNSKITNEYYCNNIPASNITVAEELIAIKGIAEINTEISNEDDNDGVPAEDEDINKNGNLDDDDTDKDGIPNYKDQDDDNDNILTSLELPNSIPGNNEPRDTDNDKIPDYLDPDDDNDGILTVKEDINNNQNPRDDDDDGNGIPNYLQNNSKQINDKAKATLKNIVNTTFRTRININDIIFDNKNEVFKENNINLGTREVSINVTTDKK